MRAVLAPLALTLLAAGCTPSSAGGTRPGAPGDTLADGPLAGTFDGYYSSGFEHSGFVPCADTSETWWAEPAAIVADGGGAGLPGGDIGGTYAAAVAPDPAALDGPTVWARLRGRTSPQGDVEAFSGAGHEGQYSRAFAVESIFEVRVAAPPDGCVPPARVRGGQSTRPAYRLPAPGLADSLAARDDAWPVGALGGTYSAGPGLSRFVPCTDTAAVWWAEGTPTLGLSYEHVAGVGPGEAGPPVWVELWGRAAGPGPRAGYSRTIEVYSVLDVRAEAPPGACARP